VKLPEMRACICLYLSGEEWNALKNKRHPRLKGERMPFFFLADFFYLARAYTARACLYPDMGPVRAYGLYALDVRLRYFLRFVIGMAHLVAAELALPANFTCSCHSTVLRLDKY
jgi:hypothetical protein